MKKKKPEGICKAHCSWFWPGEERQASCKAICPSAAYLQYSGEKVRLPTITNLEKRILRLLASGKSRKEISEELDMARDTLKHHFEVLRKKAKLLEDADTIATIDEKEVLDVKGMHIVDDVSQLDRSVYLEKSRSGKIVPLDEDI